MEKKTCVKHQNQHNESEAHYKNGAYDQTSKRAQDNSLASNHIAPFQFQISNNIYEFKLKIHKFT